MPTGEFDEAIQKAKKEEKQKRLSRLEKRLIREKDHFIPTMKSENWGQEQKLKKTATAGGTPNDTHLLLIFF